MDQGTNISSVALERVLKDLEDLEKKYQQSQSKLKQLIKETQPLKCEKEVLKRSVEEYKEVVSYYQQQYIETLKKIEDTQIKQNKFNLANLHNLKKIEQTESLLSTNKMHLNTADLKVPQFSTLKIRNDDLIKEKIRLEQIVKENDKKLKELMEQLQTSHLL